MKKSITVLIASLILCGCGSSASSEEIVTNDVPPKMLYSISRPVEYNVSEFSTEVNDALDQAPAKVKEVVYGCLLSYSKEDINDYTFVKEEDNSYYFKKDDILLRIDIDNEYLEEVDK